MRLTPGAPGTPLLQVAALLAIIIVGREDLPGTNTVAYLALPYIDTWALYHKTYYGTYKASVFVKASKK